MRKEFYKKQKQINTRMRDKKDIQHIEKKQQNDRNPSLSVIALNVNGLNSRMKRQINRMDKEYCPTICCLQKIHFRSKT